MGGSLLPDSTALDRPEPFFLEILLWGSMGIVYLFQPGHIHEAILTPRINRENFGKQCFHEWVVGIARVPFGDCLF